MNHSKALHQHKWRAESFLRRMRTIQCRLITLNGFCLHKYNHIVQIRLYSEGFSKKNHLKKEVHNQTLGISGCVSRCIYDQQPRSGISSGWSITVALSGMDRRRSHVHVSAHTIQCFNNQNTTYHITTYKCIGKFRKNNMLSNFNIHKASPLNVFVFHMMKPRVCHNSRLRMFHSHNITHSTDCMLKG